jgi:hypothetical protein
MTMVSEFFLLEPCWQGLGEGLGGGGGGLGGVSQGRGLHWAVALFKALGVPGRPKPLPFVSLFSS